MKRESKFTREQAIEKAKTGWWKTATPKEIVDFQLYEPLLCMNFGDFHEAVEKVLGRSVWTHEFANSDRLIKEYEGRISKPSMSEIIQMLPASKTVVVVEEK